MELKYQSWAEAAAAHLTKQIAGGLQGLSVEALAGPLNPDARVMAERFMAAVNESPPGFKAVIEQAMAAAAETAWPEILANGLLWFEFEHACEVGIVEAMTEKLHAMKPVGEANPRLHRVRLVVKRPYDRPLIISGDGEDLVVLDSAHRVGQFAWGPHLLEPRMGFVHGLMMSAYLGERWQETANRDLAEAFDRWLVEFLSTAPRSWTLTGDEIHAAMVFSSGKAGG